MVPGQDHTEEAHTWIYRWVKHPLGEAKATSELKANEKDLEGPVRPVTAQSRVPMKCKAQCKHRQLADLALHVLACIRGSDCPLLLLKESCQGAPLVHVINIRECLHPTECQRTAGSVLITEPAGKGMPTCCSLKCLTNLTASLRRSAATQCVTSPIWKAWGKVSAHLWASPHCPSSTRPTRT